MTTGGAVVLVCMEVQNNLAEDINSQSSEDYLNGKHESSLIYSSNHKTQNLFDRLWWKEVRATYDCISCKCIQFIIISVIFIFY